MGNSLLEVLKSSAQKRKEIKCKNVNSPSYFKKNRKEFFISIANWKKVYIFVPRMMFKNSIMALEIKAIPTLYGKEARRFRKMAEESERKYDLRIKKDITADPRYKSMLTILNNSPIFNK